MKQPYDGNQDVLNTIVKIKLEDIPVVLTINNFDYKLNSIISLIIVNGDESSIHLID